MWKRKIIVLGALFLIGLVAFSPVFAAVKDVLGHDWSEEHFALVLDLNNKEDGIVVVEDLVNSSNPAIKPDPNESEDRLIYFSYINKYGVKLAYTAMMGYMYQGENFTIDALLPYQTLFGYYKTPGGKEIFASNHFVGLVAYVTNSTDKKLDKQDDMFAGYVVGFAKLHERWQNFTNDLLGLDINFTREAKPIFGVSGDKYTVGITYYNMLVAWQNLTVAETEYGYFNVRGDRLVAMTMFEYLTFKYEIEFIPSEDNSTVDVKISTMYDFGPVSFLAIPADTFEQNAVDYLNTNTSLTGDAVTGDFETLFGNSITLAVYTGEKAVARLFGIDVGADIDRGFGISVLTATNIWSATGTRRATYNNDTLSDETEINGTVGAVVDNEKVLDVDFGAKPTYKVGDDPTDYYVEVYNIKIDRHPGVKIDYFKMQNRFMYHFGKLLVREIHPNMTAQDYEQLEVDHSLFYTVTAFSEWSGRRITHDPVIGITATVTEEAAPSGRKIPLDGMAVLAAIPILALFWRKKNKN